LQTSLHMHIIPPLVRPVYPARTIMSKGPPGCKKPAYC
jgi:hypothetical protein